MSGAAAAVLLGGCGDNPTPPEFLEPGIAMVAGVLADTVQAEPAQGLTFRVTGPEGLPRAGLVVRYEVTAVQRGGYTVIPLEVRRAGDPRFRSFVVDTTDSRGRTSIHLRLGVGAGPSTIQVTVPEYGFQHTIVFTILPGPPAGVVAEPRDTAVYGGNTLTVRGTVVDMFGNPRADALTFALLNGPVAVDGSGRVTAGAEPGRAALVARAGGRADTAYVTVVPRGWLAMQAYDPGNGGPRGITLLQLDGSEARVAAPGLDNRVAPKGFGWSADGAWLYVPRESRIHRVAGDGTETVVREFNHAVTSVRPSRDGAWIYFTLSESDWQSAAIHRMRPDGTGVERLGPATQYGLRSYDASPSPDGRYIAFVADHFGATVRVWDGTSQRDTGVQVPGVRAAWSPVANEIAYHDGEHLRLMRPDGVLLRNLTAIRGEPSAIDWSPDGRWIVISFVWGAPVTVVDAQTGQQLPLGYAGSMGEAVWRP